MRVPTLVPICSFAAMLAVAATASATPISVTGELTIVGQGTATQSTVSGVLTDTFRFDPTNTNSGHSNYDQQTGTTVMNGTTYTHVTSVVGDSALTNGGLRYFYTTPGTTVAFVPNATGPNAGRSPAYFSVSDSSVQNGTPLSNPLLLAVVTNGSNVLDFYMTEIDSFQQAKTHVAYAIDGTGYVTLNGTYDGAFVLTARNAGTSPTQAFDLTFTVASTPEPSSLALLGTGLLGAAGVIRRRMLA